MLSLVRCSEAMHLEILVVMRNTSDPDRQHAASIMTFRIYFLVAIEFTRDCFGRRYDRGADSNSSV